MQEQLSGQVLDFPLKFPFPLKQLKAALAKIQTLKLYSSELMLSMRWTQCPLPNISEAFRGNFGHRNKLMLRSDCNILQAISTETGIFLSYLYIAVGLLQCNTPYRNLTNFHT